MTVQIGVDLRNTFGPELRRLMLKTGSITECLDDIGMSLETSTHRRFEDEQDPEGNAWKEHSDATIAKRGEGAPILRDEVDLYDSISHKVQGAKVFVGANRTYARIQQLGGEAGRIGARVTIPARPYLGISADDEREIGAIVQDHLRGSA